jgi:hypothetical protein
MKPSFAPVTERHRGGSVGAARPTGVSMRSRAVPPLAAAGLVHALQATHHSAVATRQSANALQHSPDGAACPGSLKSCSYCLVLIDGEATPSRLLSRAQRRFDRSICVQEHRR